MRVNFCKCKTHYERNQNLMNTQFRQVKESLPKESEYQE